MTVVYFVASCLRTAAAQLPTLSMAALKVFLRDVQMSGPVMNLVRLMHVDLAAIGRLLSGEVVAHLYDTMIRRRRSAANFR